MADRTVKVKLTADISDYTSQLAKAAAATRTLGSNVEKNIDRDVTPVFKRAGEKQGGVLARGFNTGLVRNSPLIAAGVAAALAAGAPAVLAGATALFAGVGAVAAAQNEQVKQAWTDLGHDIRAGAVNDATVLADAYEQMAGDIGAAFQRMRPEIRDAFAASAPLIDNFTQGLTDAAENALPGLVRAVERGGPVIEGLAELMADIGTGVSDFLDAMSDNSGAAGEALAGLGDTLAAALPLLGELLGAGSELASVALPALAGALQAVTSLVSSLAPVLPVLVGGFVGLKVAQAAAGYMQAFAVQAQYATMAMTGSYSAGVKVGGALSAFGKALPGIGIAVGVLGMELSNAEQQIDSWARAMLEGGSAAAAARTEIEQNAAEIKDLAGGWSGFAADFTLAGVGIEAAGDKADETMRTVEQRARDLYNAMSPLDQAQQDVTRATNELELAVGKFGPTSVEAAVASSALATAQQVLAGRQRDIDYATQGASTAMDTFAGQMEGTRNAADDARQAIDDFKLSLDVLTGAHVSLAEAQAAFYEATSRADGALDDLSGSVLDAAGSLNTQSEAGRAAQDVLHGIRHRASLLIGTMIEQGATSEQVVAQDARLRESFIESAQQMGISRAAAEDLANEILGIPSERRTQIEADVAAAKANIVTVQSLLNSLPLFHNITVTTTYVTRGVAPSLSGPAQYDYATGGPIMAASGRIVGPGGPTDDLIPARGPRGTRYQLSNGEWIINAAASDREGDAKMAALNAGRATIVGREFSGGAAGPVVNVASPSMKGMRIVGTMDLGGGLEARIDGRVAAILDEGTDRGGFNP